MLTSGLNDILYLCANSDIFYRSLFNTSAEVLLLCTTENREVSSVKSFTVNSMFSDKSFMYIRKKSGPRIDPCGTPTFTGRVRLFEICFLKSSEEALVTNLKLPLISNYKLTLHAKLCQKPWTYPEKHILYQE